MNTTDASERRVIIHRYEHSDGGQADHFVTVLVEPDGKWWQISPHLEDRSLAIEVAQNLADALAVQCEPIPMRAGTWSEGGAA